MLLDNNHLIGIGCIATLSIYFFFACDFICNAAKPKWPCKTWWDNERTKRFLLLAVESRLLHRQWCARYELKLPLWIEVWPSKRPDLLEHKKIQRTNMEGYFPGHLNVRWKINWKSDLIHIHWFVNWMKKYGNFTVERVQQLDHWHLVCIRHDRPLFSSISDLRRLLQPLQTNHIQKIMLNHSKKLIRFYQIARTLFLYRKKLVYGLISKHLMIRTALQ